MSAPSAAGRRLAPAAVMACFLLAVGCGETDDAAAEAASPPPAAVDGAEPAPEAVSCLVLGEAPSAASFTADVSFEPDPPVVEGTTIVVAVNRDGQPVSGADVCVRADMPEMTHAGIAEQAEQVAAGRYQVETTWGMRGRWSGHARIRFDGETLVVPIERSVG